MAKKKPTPQAASIADKAAAVAESRDKKYSAAEQREYVLAVVKKQCQLDDEAAEKRAAELTAEERDELHDAGREGRVADCRELLGL